MHYLWALLSLLSAFSLATSDALTKKALKNNNEYIVAWFRLVYALPLLLVAWLFVPVPPVSSDFFKAFLIALPLELVTIVLIVKALKASPLSLTLPFLALTPVFLIVISYFILGESVSLRGASGILMIAAGSYLLNFSEFKKGLLEPFRAVIREKGSQYMIVVALLYSITSSYGKMAVEHSSAIFFGFTYFTALVICFTPVSLWMGRKEITSFLAEKKFYKLIIPGVFYSVMIITHMVAIQLTKVAYVISVKRISLLISILYGYLFFRETHLKGRFLGGLMMFAGFVIVVTAP